MYAVCVMCSLLYIDKNTNSNPATKDINKCSGQSLLDTAQFYMRQRGRMISCAIGNLSGKQFLVTCARHFRCPFNMALE